MPLVQYLAPLAVPFMLVLARITGIFVFTPLLTSQLIPRTYKAFFAFMLSAAVFSLARPAAAPVQLHLDLPSLGLVLFSEVLIGAVIGLIASMPLIAAQMAGFIMGYQMGLSLARTFNPEMEGSDSVLSQLMFTMGISVYVASGGLDMVIVAVLETFKRVPIGSFAMENVPLDLVIGVLNSGIDLAVRLAAPVSGVIILSLIAMGFIMKTMPQINILSVGFAAKILSGLIILTIVLGSLNVVIHDDSIAMLQQIIDWAQSL